MNAFTVTYNGEFVGYRMVVVAEDKWAAESLVRKEFDISDNNGEWFIYPIDMAREGCHNVERTEN